MSGGTPVAGGYVRQRHNQGCFSSADDLERQRNNGVNSSTGDDDLEDYASSRPPTYSIPALWRAWTRKEVVETVIWLIFAVIIIYYGERRSNLISLLCWDGRIKSPQKLYKKNEALLFIAPCIIMLGFLSFCLLSFSLWPIWSFLSIPLLFTLFMVVMVISPYLLIGPLRPSEFAAHAD